MNQLLDRGDRIVIIHSALSNLIVGQFIKLPTQMSNLIVGRFIKLPTHLVRLIIIK